MYSKYRHDYIRTLTLKQETFAQKYVSNGGNAAQAYRDSYACEGSNDKTIYKRANEMTKLPHVADRINELTEQHLVSHGATREWVVDSLIDFVNLAREKRKLTVVAINALAEISKMHGYHAPTESNVNSNVSLVEIGTIDNGRGNDKS